MSAAPVLPEPFTDIESIPAQVARLRRAFSSSRVATSATETADRDA